MGQQLATDRSQGASRFRWTICALLFVATVINYIDRQMIGVLKPTLQHEMAWSEGDYANIVFWFQAAYALGFLAMGRLVDIVGARIGYAISFLVWTLAHLVHGLVGSVGQFAAARFVLGLGESGSFPAGLKAVAEWFPQRERALAVGLFNAGANVGAIATPLIVSALTISYGWRTAFFVTGLIGLPWLFAWLLLYRRPQPQSARNATASAPTGVAPAEGGSRIGWLQLLRTRQTWAYVIPKFVTDPIWWMFLFWLPDFLVRRYGLDLKTFGLPLAAIYLMSDAGSVLGGWLSSHLVRRGWSVNAARKITMLACAVAALPVISVQFVDSLWSAVMIIGLATAAHQAFSANLLTLPSDLFPSRTVGSVVGIGGTAGAIGGMLIAKLVGYVLDLTGSYALIFVIAGSAYLCALAALHLVSPRMRPAELV